MENRFDRTEMLIGKESLSSLSKAKVLIFGIGGVGGYVTEALARSGIGSMVLVDNDTVSVTNINRQIIATDSTVGMYKTEVMKTRILDINPEAQVEVRNCFYLPENAEEFDFSQYDYIVDAIDTVTAKLDIIERAGKASVPVISCMGTGNKLDPTKLVVTDIYKTSVCPLAKVMRRELRKRGITGLKVVYSTEEPIKNEEIGRVPGSVAWVPPVAGLIAAAEVVKDLINKNTKE
jgi:tRNA A37 threonylcarbamoyladenosine dehydratase